MTRPILTLPLGFAPPVVEKVERLLEVLAAMREDPFLGDLFVLHGGTALNIFHRDAPRLSVDIDLMFVGALDVDAMRAMRPEVDARIREVIGALGYQVQASTDEHSGRTYRVTYPGDFLKVDVSYLARVALVDPEIRVCGFADPAVSFPVLVLEELVAGKIQALMERVAARDLYDLYLLSQSNPSMLADPLVRALALRAVCVSDPFPFVRDPVMALDKFRDASRELAEPLFATLRAGERPRFSTMLEAVTLWLKPLTVLSDGELEFMEFLGTQAVYRPELLFREWPAVSDRAASDPVMAWKVLNLGRRVQG